MIRDFKVNDFSLIMGLWRLVYQPLNLHGEEFVISIVSEELEKYAAGHSAPESELLKKLVRETYSKTDLPQMQVGHLEGAFLRLLVRISSACTVLEIGTFTGYSTLAMAGGLPDNGKIITCDIDPETTKIAQKFWNQSPDGKKIELKIGPALETLQTLKGPFDFVFIDADKENYIHYWEACLPKIQQGGLLVADNVLWSGRVLAPKEASDRAIVQFNEHVRKDKRVEAVMLTIRDGVTVAWKK